MVSITGSAAAGASSTRVDTARATQRAEAEPRDSKAEESRGSSAPETSKAEDPAVVYAGKIAEMRKTEEANAVQPTRSPAAAAVVPAARLFDITV